MESQEAVAGLARSQRHLVPLQCVLLVLPMLPAGPERDSLRMSPAPSGFWRPMGAAVVRRKSHLYRVNRAMSSCSPCAPRPAWGVWAAPRRVMRGLTHCACAGTSSWTPSQGVP